MRPINVTATPAQSLPLIPKAQMDRAPVERVGAIRDLRAELSNAGRQIADLVRWRYFCEMAW